MKVQGRRFPLSVFILLFLLAATAYGTTEKRKPDILSVESYRYLSLEKRRAYILDLRKLFFETEMALKKRGLSYVDGSVSESEIYSAIFQSKAFAEEAVPQCPIGGMVLHMVKNKSGDWKCPTTGRSCEGPKGEKKQGGGFRCGRIDGSVCVDRIPVDGISQRCAEAPVPNISPEDYGGPNGLQALLHRLQSEVACKADDVFHTKDSVPCDLFNKRIIELDAKYRKPAAQSESAPATQTERDSIPQAVEAAPPPSDPGTPQPPPPVSPIIPQVQPPTGAVPKNCKALYGLAIEGSSEEEGVADQDFHYSVGRWAEAYSAYASYVDVVPPYEHIHGITGVSSSELNEKIQGAQNVCQQYGTEIADFILGKAPKKYETTEESFFGYGKGTLPNRTDAPYDGGILEKDPTNPAAQIQTRKVFDPTTTSLDSSGLPFMTALKNLKANCKDKADPVVMIHIAGVGGDQKNCKITLGKGRDLTPDELYNNILKPLWDNNSHVVLDFNAGYSGCFLEYFRAKKLKANRPVCISSKAGPLEEGSEALIGKNFDSLYPFFLTKTNNPQKASICALAAAGTPQGYQKGLSSNANAKQIFKDISDHVDNKDEFKDLETQCLKARTSSGFPQAVFDLKTKKADVNSCEGLQDIFKKSPAAIDMINNNDDPQFWPGSNSIYPLAQTKQILPAACYVHLDSYRPSPEDTIPTAPEETNKHE